MLMAGLINALDMEQYDVVIAECLKRNYTSSTIELLMDISDIQSFLFYAEENLLPNEYQVIESRVYKFLEQ